jgi:hypothetical protein
MKPNLLALAAFLGVLLPLALFLPLPLYLFSLALFGLPHIVWEMGYLRSRYAARWPRRWWYAVGLVLLLQAGMRAGAWLGGIPAVSSVIADSLALLLLMLVVAFAPFRAGWGVRIAGLLLAAAVMWMLEQGDYLAALMLLAIAHNFTPLAMAWDMAREHPPARTLAWTITGFFMLPLLVAASGWAAAFAPLAFASYAPLLNGQLPPQWGGAYRPALLSAMVLAQCLHYYSVIHLLPRAEKQRIGMAVVAPAVRWGTVLAVVLLLAYFWTDYGMARKLYAVAAGAHAWLEWPVLLMAFLCAAGGPLSVAPGKQAS